MNERTSWVSAAGLAFWPGVILAGCIVLAGIVWSLERIGFIPAVLFSNSFDTFSGADGIFPVVLGNETFVVSGRYLRRIQRGDDGTAEQIELALPWPVDVGDILAETTEIDDETRVSRTVFLSIQRRDTIADSTERVERIYPHYLADEEPQAAFGLATRPFAQGTAYEGQQLLTTTLDDGAEFALRCDIPQVDMMPSMCRRQFMVSDTYVVVYRYHRDHLSDWRDIDGMVSKVFDELRSPPQEGS